MNLMKKLFYTSLLSLLFNVASAQGVYPLQIENELLNQEKWVDSIYNSMSLNEKVGQLFMVDVFSKDPVKKTNLIDSLIKNYHIGGIIFSKGGPLRQAKLNNQFHFAFHLGHRLQMLRLECNINDLLYTQKSNLYQRSSD